VASAIFISSQEQLRITSDRCTSNLPGCPPQGLKPSDLFTESQPAKTDELLTVLDRINGKFGKSTLHSGRMALSAGWAMKREMMSQSYTTSIKHLMKFQAS
jgi:hypothetical protein